MKRTLQWKQRHRRRRRRIVNLVTCCVFLFAAGSAAAAKHVLVVGTTTTTTNDDDDNQHDDEQQQQQQQQQQQHYPSRSSSSSILSRITLEEQDNQDRSFPFLGSLLDQNGEHQCGATLISSNILITAAHCFNKNNIEMVRLISSSQNNNTFSIQETRTHPRYYYHTYTGGIDVDPYDVAIIQINTNNAMNETVQMNRNPQLPNNDEQQEQQLLGLGWDLLTTTTAENNNTSNNNVPSVIKTTILQYVPNKECIEINGISSNGIHIDYETQIIDVSLCALYQNQSQSSTGGDDGQEEEGLCLGDSGGPILLLDKNNNNNSLLMVGIISSSYGCSHTQLPTLNVRITEILEWIDDTVCELSQDPPDDDSFDCNIIGHTQTTTNPPITTSIQTNNHPYVTVIINLDSYPTETGYILEAVMEDGIPPITIQTRYPGSFTIPNQTIEERIVLLLLPLPPSSSLPSSSSSSSSKQRYRFTITDNEHDGLHPGQYQVWLGEPSSSTGTLLFEGSEFFLEESHVFEVPADIDSSSTTTASSGLVSLYITGILCLLLLHKIMF